MTTTTCPKHVRILVGHYVGCLRKKANPNQNPTVTGICRPKTRTQQVQDDQRVWSALDALDLVLVSRIDQGYHSVRSTINTRWRGVIKTTLGIEDGISDWDLVRTLDRSEHRDVSIVDVICEVIVEMIDEGRITLD